ncbi:MAG: hypothetical protein ACXWD8_17720 [Mycobacterium sp.]
MSSDASRSIRGIAPAMRSVLVLGAVFVAVAGVQLYLLTNHTDTIFAWTIGVHLSAAFLGAFYWTACVMSGRSIYKKAWADVRVGIYGVFVFECLTLLTTFLHADLFHFGSSSFSAKGAAFAWLIIYLLDPLLIVFGLFQQSQMPGKDPVRIALLPRWYRTLLGVQAAGLIAVGVALFIVPQAVNDIWPWPLTPLTARAMSAWIVGLGVIQAHAALENAWERIDVAVTSYVVLGLLQLVALALYSDEVRWDTAAIWVYLLVLITVLIMGAVGVARRRTALGAAIQPA